MTLLVIALLIAVLGYAGYRWYRKVAHDRRRQAQRERRAENERIWNETMTGGEGRSPSE